MNCDRAEKVSLLIDDELTKAEGRELERHLLECESCQTVRNDFLSLRRQITDYTPTLDRATLQQTLDRILQSPERPVATIPRRRSFTFEWNFGRVAWAFAGLLLIALGIGIATYRNIITKQAPEINAKSHQPEVKVPISTPNSDVAPTAKQVAQNAATNSTAKLSPSGPTNRGRFDPPTRTANADPQIATVSPENLPLVRSADAETLTAIHFEKSELLLRGFRNVRLDEPGEIAEVGYERNKAKQLVYQNMMLRREADAAGDVQIASLLESLEPILIDIANLPDKPADDDIRIIRERVERKNIVALLQVNSTALARALD